jgi:hypothetical protein
MNCAPTTLRLLSQFKKFTIAIRGRVSDREQEKKLEAIILTQQVRKTRVILWFSVLIHTYID